MKFVHLAAAVAAFAATGAAHAQDAFTVEGKPSAYVSYADLDLASQTGRDALYGRVRTVATSLCGANEMNILSQRMEGLRCRDDAIAGARSQIELAIARNSAPNGTALAAAASGSSTIAVSLR